MAEAKTIRQTIRFQPDTEVVFPRTLRGARLVKFRIQFRATFGSHWHSVLRYDHAHGPIHRHRCWVRGEPSEEVGPFAALPEALDWCLVDLERNAEAALQEAKASYTNTVHIEHEAPDDQID